MKALKELEPSKCDRKKFDLDLKFGKIGEKKVAEMLLDGKIEVNGLVVKVPSLKLKSGDVVTCTDSKSLLWYYIQR